MAKVISTSEDLGRYNLKKTLYLLFFCFCLILAGCPTSLPNLINASFAAAVNNLSQVSPDTASDHKPSPALPVKQSFNVAILSNDELSQLQGSPWELTFAQLNQHPEYQFKPMFLKQQKLMQYVNEDAVDFVITDAINYLHLEKQYGALRLLTRNVLYENVYFSYEAISVYVSNLNTRINQISDLKQKIIAVLDRPTTISQQRIEHFLRSYQIDPNQDVKFVSYSSLDIIMQLLHSEKVDALLIKSGYLEKEMQKQSGKLVKKSEFAALHQLHIVNPHKGWQAPFLHTSELVPEWVFAKAWFVDEQLAAEIAGILLLTNIADEEKLHYSDQYFWSIPKKYSGFLAEHTLNTVLSQADSNSLDSKVKNISPVGSEFFTHKEYWIALLSFLALFIIFVLYLKSSHDLNRRLQKSKASLEQEIQERQHAQKLAMDHQAELAHVARLNTMGEMTSGLAHELNQPLSAIHTYVQGCIRRINMGNDEPEAIINALELTAQQANRAGEIIRRLRGFVRKGETHKTYTDINHIVKEVTNFLDNQFKDSDVQIKYQLEDNLPPVFVDIIQMEQVLINLIRNAMESMQEEDEQLITLYTSRLTPELIELCVIDTGHGISEDKLNRIFNPFFTTKESGMGMGLSISQSIIEAHDGKLYAKNNPKKGARFCFSLPVKAEQALKI